MPANDAMVSLIERKARAEVGAVVGRREAGKQERRQRIIQAAREMFRESGDASLSMRDLAARAGVSLATPYNLFGSKHAIVVAVLGDARDYLERFAALRSADPIATIFAALDLALDYYQGDPKFYKTLWAALFKTTNEMRSDIFNLRREAFWVGLVSDAIGAGALCATIDPRIIVTQLDLILRCAMHGWALGEIGKERLSSTVSCGFALVLAGVATPAWRGPLQARLLNTQAKLLMERRLEPAST
jgi:AcrR family transcriptional regulator